MDQSQIEVGAKPESPYQHHFDQVSLQEKLEVLDYATNQREKNDSTLRECFKGGLLG